MRGKLPIRTTTVVVLLAAALALSAGIGVATGAIPSSSGKISACAPTGGGQLRVIDRDKQHQCNAGEQLLDWNQQGPRGVAGPAGPKGDRGPKGDTGPAGQFPGTLPSGTTLRGAYSVFGTAAASGEFATSPVSFGIALASSPAPHFVGLGDSPDPSCPGTAEAPEAAPGHLCLYEGRRNNVLVAFFDDPLTGSTGTTVRAFGAEVGVRSDKAGDFGDSGSWAVTAS